MKWAFPVAAGTPLQVRLYFANRCTLHQRASAQRVFDVAVDGSPVLTNYDIVADVGDQTGTMKSFNLTVPATGRSTSTSRTSSREPARQRHRDRPDRRRRRLRAASDGLTQGRSEPRRLSLGARRPLRTAASRGVQHPRCVHGRQQGVLRQTDGYLYSRTFNGTTWGPAVQINPYHDPAWKNVDNHLGGTFDGNLPTLYGQMPNVTGMFYDGGRLYYTLFGDSRLYSRWFSPDSGIVDERTNTVAELGRPAQRAGGIFAAGDSLYFASRTDSTLYKVSLVGFGRHRVAGGRSAGRPSTASTGPAGRCSSTAARRSTRRRRRRSARRARTRPAPSTATSSDSDGTIASYAWTFGDTQTSTTGPVVTHAYSASGTYPVTLKVTDDQGARATRPRRT